MLCFSCTEPKRIRRRLIAKMPSVILQQHHLYYSNRGHMFATDPPEFVATSITEVVLRRKKSGFKMPKKKCCFCATTKSNLWRSGGIEGRSEAVCNKCYCSKYRERKKIGPSKSETVPHPDVSTSQLMGSEHEHWKSKYLKEVAEHELLKTQYREEVAEHELLKTKYREEVAEHDRLKIKYLEEVSQHDLFKRRYPEEASERRRLYNDVIELKGNIRVFCRCRPLNEREIANGSTSVVNFDFDKELQVLFPDAPNAPRKRFQFDHVFRPEDNQEAVFAQAQPIVKSVMDGFNVCIFAYGQTGTGKTFTMERTPEHRGVNYRSVEELFRLSEERRAIVNYEFRLTMLEIYKEDIRDLLVGKSNQPTKKLEIRQVDGTQEAPGLCEAHVNGTEEVWEMRKNGNRVRSVGTTSANALSSRSHCLLRIRVFGENIINGERTRSDLWLVDLAGSE